MGLSDNANWTYIEHVNFSIRDKSDFLKQSRCLVATTIIAYMKNYHRDIVNNTHPKLFITNSCTQFKQV